MTWEFFEDILATRNQNDAKFIPIYSAHRTCSHDVIWFYVAFKFAPKVRPIENRLFTGTSEKDGTYTIRICASLRFKRFIGNQNSLAKIHQKCIWNCEKASKVGKMAKMDKKDQSCYNLRTEKPISVKISKLTIERHLYLSAKQEPNRNSWAWLQSMAINTWIKTAD